jgi:nicotinamidase-related amidase
MGGLNLELNPPLNKFFTNLQRKEKNVMKVIEALVIIDMQPRFEASAEKKTNKEIIKQIQEAKKKKAPIIVLEYWGEPKTRLNIRRALGNYEKVHRVIKENDSGASVLKPVLRALDKDDKKKIILKVCGVNTGACVYRTVKDISTYHRVKQVHVIWDGCNDNWGTQPTVFKRLKNCRVIL